MDYYDEYWYFDSFSLEFELALKHSEGFGFSIFGLDWFDWADPNLDERSEDDQWEGLDSLPHQVRGIRKEAVMRSGGGYLRAYSRRNNDNSWKRHRDTRWRRVPPTKDVTGFTILDASPPRVVKPGVIVRSRTGSVR